MLVAVVCISNMSVAIFVGDMDCSQTLRSVLSEIAQLLSLLFKRLRLDVIVDILGLGVDRLHYDLTWTIATKHKLTLFCMSPLESTEYYVFSDGQPNFHMGFISVICLRAGGKEESVAGDVGNEDVRN
jgi:hypothetical protein